MNGKSNDLRYLINTERDEPTLYQHGNKCGTDSVTIATL